MYRHNNPLKKHEALDLPSHESSIGKEKIKLSDIAEITARCVPNSV